MAIKSIFLIVLAGTVLHCVAGAEQCSLGDSVGKLLQSCQALKQCPDGWVINKQTGSCYTYIREALSWSAARSKCLSYDGADMASLSTKEEMGFAYDYIFSAIGTAAWTNVWIGLERDGNGWRWLDGSTLTLSATGFWSPNEPNDAGAGEDVVEMYSNSLTNDKSRSDSNERHVICEMKM